MFISAALGSALAGENGTYRSTQHSSIASAVDGLRVVDVIDRSEIELSGMRNLWDLLAGRRGYDSFGLFAPFALRSGLGNRRFLVLVNGRRVSDSTFDLDAFPVSGVERIEILRGSSVALLGPEALAGAINIVLRHDFEGVESEGGVESPVGAGGFATHAGGLWGGAVGAGHLTLGVDRFHRDEIRAADRDYSRSSWTEGGSFDDASNVSTAGNTAFFFYLRSAGPAGLTAHSRRPVRGRRLYGRAPGALRG